MATHEIVYLYFLVVQNYETATLRDFIYFSYRCENKWQINVESSTCFVFVINLMFFFSDKSSISSSNSQPLGSLHFAIFQHHDHRRSCVQLRARCHVIDVYSGN